MNVAPKVWIKIIAALEMTGGIVGNLFMVYVAVAAGFAWSVLIILPVMIAIFSLSFFAGFQLWKGSEFGRKASIAVQVIQLPKFYSPFLVFSFSFGFDLFPHLTLVNSFSTVGIQVRFLADGQLFVNSGNDGILLGSSVPAILALIKLWNLTNYETNEAVDAESPPPSPGEYKIFEP